MVQELRKIILTNEEVIFALESYRRVERNFLPDGKIIGCNQSKDGKIIVDVALNHQAGKSTSFTFGIADLIKPLIRFCLENNIVLPIEGKKSVSFTDGALSLCIVLKLDTDFG